MNPDFDLLEILRDLPVNLTIPDLLRLFVQIGILVYLFFQIYSRFLTDEARRILRGMLAIVPLFLLLYILQLNILTRLLELLIPAFGVGIFVLFANEIRTFLSNVGRDGFQWLGMLPWIKESTDHDARKSIQSIATQVIKAIEILSRNKAGALIVFDNAWSDRLYVNAGCALDATVSTELLLNIFYPKSPLHDGAVLVRNRRIHSASVILPITENPKLNPWQYGTRHRAALGISEHDPTAFCIIVSEETGGVSIAEAGRIIKVTDLHDLQSRLEERLETSD